MKELECSQHYTSIFQTHKGRYSGVGGGIWPKFKLIHVIMHVRPNFELFLHVMDVLVTCKNEEDPIKNESSEWSQDFPHYNPMGAICCHRNQSSDPIWPKT